MKSVCHWLLLLALLGVAAPAAADRQQLLQAFRDVQAHAARRVFDEPLFIRSRSADDDLGADIYAILPQPFSKVRAALAQADEWCRFLVLNQNVKACTWRPGGDGAMLSLFVGRKFYQPPRDAFQINGDFQVRAAQDDYLRVTLQAAEGPLGTRDYRIFVQATPVE